MRSASFTFWLCVPLAAAVLISAVWVIKTKHQSRQLFVEIEARLSLLLDCTRNEVVRRVGRIIELQNTGRQCRIFADHYRHIGHGKIRLTQYFPQP